MKMRTIGAVICASVAAVGVTACGSSSKSSSSSASTTARSPAATTPASTPTTATTSTTSSGASTTATATGAPIVLGSICGCSGPQAAVLGGSEKVMTAWADSVNAAGGINGHPVKLIVKDDGENPAQSLQDAKELIEQDHVIALVGDTTTVDSGYASYVQSAGVPVVGGASPEPSYLTNPDFFPSGGNLIALTFGTIEVAKKAGKKNLGVLYCAESPVCAEIVPLAQGMSKLIGIKITPLKVSSTAPSYTAPCLTLKSAGVDSLYVADNGPVIERILAACVQQGYKPLNVGQDSTFTPELLKSSTFEGTLAAFTSSNVYDTSLPATATEIAALNKYEPGFTTGAQFTSDMIYPWSGALLFEDAAKAGNLGPSSTAADVTQALYSLKDETVQGTSGPLIFTAGKPAEAPCWFNSSITGGKVISSNRNKPSCLTAAEGAGLAPILKALG